MPVLRAILSPGLGSKIYLIPEKSLTIRCVASDLGALSTTRISCGYITDSESEFRQRFRDSGRSRVQIMTVVEMKEDSSVVIFSRSISKGCIILIKASMSRCVACNWSLWISRCNASKSSSAR